MTVEDLETRVAELEEALGLTKTLPDKTRRKFGFTKRPSVPLLGMLMKREIVTRESVFLALYSSLTHADQPSDKCIDVYIVDVRAGLRRIGVKLKIVWGRGWYLDADDKRKITEFLGAATKDIAA